MLRAQLHKVLAVWLGLAGLLLLLVVSRVAAAEPINWARTAQARQLTTSLGAEASRAIDGNTNGDLQQGSVTLAAVGSAPAGVKRADWRGDEAQWLELALPEPVHVGRVVIYNRTDCCAERLLDARVELSRDPCDQPTRRVRHSARIPTVAPRTELVFIDAPEVRFVCVRHDKAQDLSVAEVEVYSGTPAVNLARRGVASQSSVGLGGSAERAIDGWTEGNYALASVTHSAQGDLAPQLQLDLQGEQAIGRVALWNRTDCCSGRLGGALVEVSVQPCNARRPLFGFTLPKVLERRTELDFAGAVARYVCVSSGARPLSLAELEVFAPDPGGAARFALRYAATQPTGSGSVDLRADGTFSRDDVSAGRWGLEGSSLLLKWDNGLTSVLEQGLDGALHGAAGPGAMSLQRTGASPKQGSSAAASDVARTETSRVQTADGSFELRVKNGELALGHCGLRRRTDGKYLLSCPALPEQLVMIGTLSGPSDFDLRSDAALAPARALEILKPILGAETRQAVDWVLGALPVQALRLRLSRAKGLSLLGTGTFGSPGTPNPVSTALRGVDEFLGLFIPGQASPLSRAAIPFEVVPFVSGLSAGAQLYATLADTCVGQSLAETGTGFLLHQAHLVLTVRSGLSIAGVTNSVTASLDSPWFLKPTARDPWLKVVPGATVDLLAGKGTLRGRVLGACEASCVASCSCSDAQCSGEWQPLGLRALAMKDGYVEVGPGPLPNFAFSFERARLGDITGQYALALHLPDDVGMRWVSDRAPVLPLLAFFGDVRVVEHWLPRDLSVREPSLSLATQGLMVNRVSVPAGASVRGAMDLSKLGLGGTLTLDAALPKLNLKALLARSGTSWEALAGAPLGAFRLLIDTSEVQRRVLAKLPPATLWVMERAFSVSEVVVGLHVGVDAVAPTASVRFTVIGQHVTLSIPVEVAFHPEQLADAIAREVNKRVGDPVAGAVSTAYRSVTRALQSTAKAAASASVRGKNVVYDGILTAGEVLGVTPTSAPTSPR